MPVPSTPSPRNSPGRVGGWAPGAGDVVLLGGILNLTYAAVVISALARPQARLSAWVAAWIEIAGKGLKPAYALAGSPDCGGVRPSAFVGRAWTFDVHLVTINLVVAAALFAASRPFWKTWAAQLYRDPRWRDGPPDARRADAEAGFGLVIWGAIAAAWLMVLKNDLFDSAARCASLRPWFLFREPLLATAGQGLANLAAALWTAQRR
jgi:hypothetical protein